MTLTSDKILETIKEKKLAPVPRWHFLFKSCVFWTLFVFSMILGSVSFSVIVHVVNSGDFDIVNHLQGNLLTSAVMVLPYFWLFSLIVFALSAYFNWKSTKLGYKFKRRWIVLGSVVLSIFFGSILNTMGMGKQIDFLMTRSLPFYNQTKHAALRELWQHPEKGFLTGKVMEIDENQEKIILKDEDGKEWSVSDDAVIWENRSLENKGKVIKVIGEKTSENNFRAKEIRRCTNCQDDEDNNDSRERSKKAETCSSKDDKGCSRQSERENERD